MERNRQINKITSRETSYKYFFDLANIPSFFSQRGSSRRNKRVHQSRLLSRFRTRLVWQQWWLQCRHPCPCEPTKCRWVLLSLPSLPPLSINFIIVDTQPLDAMDSRPSLMWPWWATPILACSSTFLKVVGTEAALPPTATGLLVRKREWKMGEERN